MIYLGGVNGHLARAFMAGFECEGTGQCPWPAADDPRAVAWRAGAMMAKAEFRWPAVRDHLMARAREADPRLSR